MLFFLQSIRFLFIALTVVCLSTPFASLVNGQEKAGMNVLLVVFDDLNMDIGAYGDRQVKTPHLDAFAKRAVRFDQAHCNGPYCAPSRTSFINGLHWICDWLFRPPNFRRNGKPYALDISLRFS